LLELGHRPLQLSNVAEPVDMNGLECVLIGYSEVEARAKHNRQGSHVFLIVDKIRNDIYERKGIGMVSKSCWSTAKPEQRLIKLG
jgi:hypothetical protein